MTGPLICSSALALGGIFGCFLGNYLPSRIKENLPLIFGVLTLSIGTTLVGKSSALHVVTLALIIGTLVGELLRLEYLLEKSVRQVMQWSASHTTADNNTVVQYITLISVFCFGSMGIFGALSEGASGKPDILLTKAVLDFFSGLLFGSVLGIRISLIAIPQFLILAGIYCSASFILSHATPAMFSDFSSCGGVIFLATGLRMSGIKQFPVINMLPSLLIVAPLSSLFTHYMPVG